MVEGDPVYVPILDEVLKLITNFENLPLIELAISKLKAISLQKIEKEKQNLDSSLVSTLDPNCLLP